jgi:ABC-type uncharacterized transport system ATPase component
VTVFDKTKVLYLIITHTLSESVEYGRDAVVISVVGKMDMGNSKHSDYWCITLNLHSE